MNITLSKKRFLYSNGVVPIDEVQYFKKEIKEENNIKKIILLLCAAKDLIENITEYSVEENKDYECRILIYFAIKKLEICKNNCQNEHKAIVSLLNKAFNNYENIFDQRFINFINEN